jgi:hypothetical protein
MSISIRIIIILLFLGSISCSVNEYIVDKDYVYSVEDSKVALKFINSYIESIEKSDAIELLESSNEITSSFLVAYKSFVRNYEMEYSHLDFDPIINAQDFPEDGFELEQMDSINGVLYLRGINWKDFKLQMKIKRIDGIVLVDGSGVVNVKEN